MMSHQDNNPELKSLDDLIDTCLAGDYSIRDEILRLCYTDPAILFKSLDALAVKITQENTRIHADAKNEIDQLKTPLRSILRDETPFDLPDILKFARERLGHEAPCYKTLMMMRLKQEILAALNLYVLSGTRETPLLQECIDKIYFYAGNEPDEFGVDVANLLQSGLYKPTNMYSISSNYRNNKMSGDEAQANKKRIRDEIKSSLYDRPNDRTDLEQLLIYFINKDVIDSKRMAHMLEVWDALPDKIAAQSNVGLIHIAILCELFIFDVNHIYLNLKMGADESAHEKLSNISCMQILNSKIQDKIHAVATEMLERLSWLNPDDLLYLKSSDHDKKFINDKILQFNHSVAYAKFVKRYAQEQNYEFKHISVTQIIKFLLYISLKGTPEQKREVYMSQPGSPEQPEIIMALQAKLAQWKLACPQSVKDIVIKLMLDNIIVNNQEYLALQQLLTTIKASANDELMLFAFNLAFEKKIIKKNSFVKLCQLIEMIRSDANHGKILYAIINCCRVPEDIINIEKYYRDLVECENIESLDLLNTILNRIPRDTESRDLEYVIRVISLFDAKYPLLLSVVKHLLGHQIASDDEIVPVIQGLVTLAKKFKPQAIMNVVEMETIHTFAALVNTLEDMDAAFSPLDKIIFYHFDRKSYFEIMPVRLDTMNDIIALDGVKQLTPAGDVKFTESDNACIAEFVEMSCLEQNAEAVKLIASDVAELMVELGTVLSQPITISMRNILSLITSIKNQCHHQRIDALISNLFHNYLRRVESEALANQIYTELLNKLVLANDHTYYDYSVLIDTTYQIVTGLDVAMEFNDKKKQEIKHHLVKSLQLAGETQSQEALREAVKPLLEVKSSFKMKALLCNFVSVLLKIVGIISSKAKQSSKTYSNRACFFQEKVKHVDVMNKGLEKLRVNPAVFAH